MDPLIQAGLFFATSVLFMLLAWAIRLIGLIQFEQLFPWSIASGLLLLFAVFNSMMSLNADNSARYWGRSIYGFLGLAFANGLAAWLFSGVPIGAAQSYRWIYIVITICLLIMLSMVNLMKKIVQFAEREEWTQPRRRRW